MVSLPARIRPGEAATPWRDKPFTTLQGICQNSRKALDFEFR